MPSIGPRLAVERPPTKIEVDYTLLLRLRSEARKRDMPTAYWADSADRIMSVGLLFRACCQPAKTLHEVRIEQYRSCLVIATFRSAESTCRSSVRPVC
jgi:hypothetical protein